MIKVPLSDKHITSKSVFVGNRKGYKKVTKEKFYGS